MLYTSPWEGVEPTTSVLIGTDCIGSCKSNYHTIMTTTARYLCDKGKSRLLFVVETRDTFKNEGSDIDYWKTFVGQSTFCFPCERQTDIYVCTYMIYMLSTILLYGISLLILLSRCRRGRDCMIVGFTSTFAINVHHHYLNEFDFRSGKVYSIQHYMIKFVSDLRQVGDLLLFSPWIKMTSEI